RRRVWLEVKRIELTGSAEQVDEDARARLWPCCRLRQAELLQRQAQCPSGADLQDLAARVTVAGPLMTAQNAKHALSVKRAAAQCNAIRWNEHPLAGVDFSC